MKKIGKKDKIKEYDKVISLDEHRRELVYSKVLEIIDELKEDGGKVSLTDVQLRTILGEFYEYYRKKSILFFYEESMTNHFNDIADDAYEEDADMDLEYTLGELALYELIDSRIEVNPKDTKELIKSIRSKNK